MHDLLRSVLDRDVDVGGKRYVIRPPTVKEALAIIASAPGVLRGEPLQRDVLFDTLERWLPPELYGVLTEDDYPADRVVVYVYSLLSEGVPDINQPKTNGDGSARSHKLDIKKIPWQDVVADYMAAYGQSLASTLAEPWGGFLFMASKIDQVQAREQIRTIEVNSLPWIKETISREKAINRLMSRAGAMGATEDDRKRKQRERQMKNLEALKAAFAEINKNPNA